MPNIAFLESAPFVVIDREDALLSGISQMPPHLDIEFAKGLVERSISLREPKLSMRGVLEFTRSPKLREKRNRFVKFMYERTEELRNKLKSDTKFAAMVKGYVDRNIVQCGTRQLTKDILKILILDHGTKMTENNVFDLLHTVVPAAYCDFVLLDSQWASKVEQAKERLQKAGVVGFPIAKVYSQKRDGMNQFLADFEGFSLPTISIG